MFTSIRTGISSFSGNAFTVVKYDASNLIVDGISDLVHAISREFSRTLGTYETVVTGGRADRYIVSFDHGMADVVNCYF